MPRSLGTLRVPGLPDGLDRSRKGRAMRHETLIAAMMIGLVGVGALAQPERAGQPQERDALNTLRRINSAQASAQRVSKAGTFSTLSALAESDPTLKSLLTDLTDNAGSIQGYQVAVTLSSDGKAYQVSLIPSTRCAPALFSDDQGLIYRGSALGCPAQP